MGRRSAVSPPLFASLARSTGSQFDSRQTPESARRRKRMPISESNPVSAGPSEVFALPTSLAQERFWRLYRMNPGNPTWSVPVRFRLQGALETQLVERAFNEIVRRHEVLRTTFALLDGKPVHVIRSSVDIEVP